MGPNYVLDKGFLVSTTSGTTGILNFGECVKLGANNTTVTRCDASNELVLGVAQETLDTAKIATGKATVDVRILGITRAIAAAAITRFTKVVVTTTGRVTPITGTAGVNNQVVGIALTPASANGDQIDLLLTPGATTNAAAS